MALRSRMLSGMFGPLRGSAVFRSAGVYTAANILNSAVPLLLMPVLTRHLSAAEYGIVAMFQVLLGLTTPFVGINVHGAVQRRYYDADQDGFPEYVGNALLILVASSLTVACVFLVLGRHIAGWTQFPADWLWAVIPVAAGGFVMNVRLAILQAEVRPFAFGVLQVARTVVNLSVSLLLVVVLRLGWEGRVTGQVVAFAGFGAVSLFLLWKEGWVQWRPDWKSIRHALRFGVPLIPHALASYLMLSIDQLFITNMRGVSETGIYLVAAQFGFGMGTLLNALNTAYTPWLFQQLKADSPVVDARVVRFTYRAMLGISIFGLLVALLVPPFLSVWVGEEYQRAGRFVQWLAAGYAFNGMYMLVTNYLFFANRTHLVTVATITAACINLVLNYVLIRANGALGAAQATAATFLCKFLLTWVLSARAHPMPWMGRGRLPA